MEQVNTTERLSALRALMKERNVDIYSGFHIGTKYNESVRPPRNPD